MRVRGSGAAGLQPITASPGQAVSPAARSCVRPAWQICTKPGDDDLRLPAVANHYDRAAGKACGYRHTMTASSFDDADRTAWRWKPVGTSRRPCCRDELATIQLRTGSSSVDSAR